MKILTLTIVLLVGAPVLGYPQQERLMPDGAPVPEDAVDHEDSVAAASEVGSDEYDDSDMYMEPDGAESVREVNREEGSSSVLVPKPEDEETPASVEETNAEERISEKTVGEESADEEEDPSDKSLESDSQNFFPSFAKLFANHRTPFEEQQQQQQQPQQQQHYRPNRFLGYFQRDHEAYQASAASDSPHPILGSGNFGVIRGGTYYPEEKENDEYSVDETLYNPYFQGSRARANYYRNPKPQPVRGGDFFANFRDFADITAPPKSSFSHLSVVYANKNGTRGRITEPRNIIETLRMLEQDSESTTTEIPQKKLSKGKRKLLKLKKYQDDKTRKSRMTIEPLLALS